MKPSIVTNAAFSAVVFATPVGQAVADCRFSGTAEGKPEGFTQEAHAKLNPSRHDIALRSTVEKTPKSEIAESGIIESGSRFGTFGVWGCNFSTLRESDGKRLALTAKHCIGNEFDGVNSDVWISESFSTASVRVKITNRTEKVLEAAPDVPINGGPVKLSGCIPSGDGCFRVEGTLEELFVKGDETVRGIWLTPDNYAKMVGDKVEKSLDGFSGTPAQDSEGRVFGVVSATLQADFKEDSNGKCLPNAFGIAIAPIRNK